MTAVRPLTNPAVLLTLLLLVNVVNYMDRMVLSVLLVPIKAEFDISDTEVGFVTGFGFAFFYALAGIVIGKIADRVDRVRLLSLAVAFWSLMTVATGGAQTFMHLLLARLGVGIGEASAVPTGFALISDSFPLEKRAAPMAVFASGSTIGTLVGMAAGGWIGSMWGWRTAFFLAGAVGLLLAPVLLLLLRDVPRGFSDTAASSKGSARVADLFRNGPYLRMAIGAALFSFVLFGVSTWMPAYFVRRFDLALAEVGLQLGLALGIGGGLGMIAGGLVTNRLTRSDVRWLAWLPCLAALGAFPFYQFAMFAETSWLASVLLCAGGTIGGMAYGAISTAMLAVVDSGIRVRAAAVSTVLGSVLGIGSGPLVVGLVSDGLRADLGDAGALRAGLAVCVSAMLLAAWLFYGAGPALRARLARQEAS